VIGDMMDRNEINAIYDAFDNKDMSREQFHQEMQRLLDPQTMAEDFARLRHMRDEKDRVDKALRGQK